jgi:dihydrofolate synthase/folylpolyglutamate synthase
MKVTESYPKALEYLYSFVDYSLSKSFRYAQVKFELGRLQKLMELIGNPHLHYPILHVAGTKGKGSVTAMCAQVIRESGYTVGMYTSPHLHEYTERIQVNGQPMPKEDLVSLLEEIKPAIGSVPDLTTFEITTALGLLYFKRQHVDAAVVEVGLGGRLDATNVVLPVVSVITSISYDHMFILGNTLAEIAAEKAGIIKPGVPVVEAPQESEAQIVIEKVAQERGSPVYRVGRDYFFKQVSHSLDGQSLIVWSATDQQLMNAYIESGGKTEWAPVYLKIPLLGYHQVENAATAYAAIQVFRQNSLKINDRAIVDGFANTYWPGRFEVLQRNPPVVVDSAHNRDSARKLRMTLDDYFPGTKVILVFGASEDKDLAGMFAELMPRVQEVIATRSFHPRAIDPKAVVEIVHQFGFQARIIDSVADALDQAIQLTRAGVMVLVTGSIFIVSEAREAWYKQKETIGEKI